MIEVLAARGAWCRPEESILWLLPLKKEGGMPFVLYRVSGAGCGRQAQDGRVGARQGVQGGGRVRRDGAGRGAAGVR